MLKQYHTKEVSYKGEFFNPGSNRSARLPICVRTVNSGNTIDSTPDFGSEKGILHFSESDRCS